MKTAQEWIQRWAVDNEDRPDLLKTIHEIQQDAYRAGLLRAAEICSGKIWARGIHGSRLMRETIDAIEAEAQKGQQ